ncbi:MAG: argininosuccinate synthase [Gemmatimonadales bacterium]
MEPLVVLAYSGGVDTSAIVPWLRENYGVRVLCYAADVGQGEEELRGLEAKAICSGAVGCIIDDLRERLVTEFVFPTLKAGAVYARSYLLGTAIARPVIAAGQVAVARDVGATALAHGCTGKGNDQVRFELTYRALAPELTVIAPWRIWDFRGREDLLAYLRGKDIDVAASEAKPFSRDRNLWHCSHEGGSLEDPGQAPPSDLFLMTSDLRDAPDAPELVTVGFEGGTPVSVDGRPLGPVALVEALNDLAGAHGVGREDLIEDRLVGMKSRGVYETPAGTVLRAAHRALEQLVLDRRTLDLKDQLSQRYAELVYQGWWWSTEREALDALVDVTQSRVTGTAQVQLYKGSVTVLSRESPFSLYSAEHATFEADEVFDQVDASGFINLFSLPARMGARIAQSEPVAALEPCP